MARASKRQTTTMPPKKTLMPKRARKPASAPVLPRPETQVKQSCAVLKSAVHVRTSCDAGASTGSKNDFVLKAKEEALAATTAVLTNAKKEEQAYRAPTKKRTMSVAETAERSTPKTLCREQRHAVGGCFFDAVCAHKSIGNAPPVRVESHSVRALDQCMLAGRPAVGDGPSARVCAEVECALEDASAESAVFSKPFWSSASRCASALKKIKFCEKSDDPVISSSGGTGAEIVAHGTYNVLVQFRNSGIAVDVDMFGEESALVRYARPEPGAAKGLVTVTKQEALEEAHLTAHFSALELGPRLLSTLFVPAAAMVPAKALSECPAAAYVHVQILERARQSLSKRLAQSLADHEVRILAQKCIVLLSRASKEGYVLLDIKQNNMLCCREGRVCFCDFDPRFTYRFDGETHFNGCMLLNALFLGCHVRNHISNNPRALAVWQGEWKGILAHLLQIPPASDKGAAMAWRARAMQVPYRDCGSKSEDALLITASIMWTTYFWKVHKGNRLACHSHAWECAGQRLQNRVEAYWRVAGCADEWPDGMLKAEKPLVQQMADFVLGPCAAP